MSLNKFLKPNLWILSNPVFNYPFRELKNVEFCDECGINVCAATVALSRFLSTKHTFRGVRWWRRRQRWGYMDEAITILLGS